MAAPGRQMVLVPIELLDQLKKSQQNITPLINPVKDQLLKSMTKLDATLLDSHLPDDVKSNHIGQIGKDLSIYADKVSGVVTNQPKPQPHQNITPSTVHNVLSNSFPKTLQSQANNLLTILKSKPEKISWDPDTSEVTIQGRKLNGSNIVDLVGDIMRKRKVRPPEYANEFLHALAKLNVPEELIRNTDRISAFRSYKRTDDNVPVPVNVGSKRKRMFIPGIPNESIFKIKRKRKLTGSKLSRGKAIKWLSQ